MPVTTRSKLMLEVASELVAQDNRFWQQAVVSLRAQGPEPWGARLFASDTPSGIDAVVRGEADVAIVNPSGPLTVAYRGKGPWREPQPVRVVTCIPSYDQFVFAVTGDLGLNTFEEIGEKRVPIKVSLRGQADHSTHFMLDHIMEASGFSIRDLRSWGGETHYHHGLANAPHRIPGVKAGEGINAVFDEAVNQTAGPALEIGMKVLPLREETVRKLEAMGYRRGIIAKKDVPKLPQDVLTIDFSGWPVFCRETTSDELVTAFCAGLEARKDRIPWQGDGPLPLERMCFDTPDGPLDVPLHPAAERFWRERGYLK
ncbi:MAG TPA: TAXI family TRAP transporter solute-binding subunit [Chloroflexota bacterium]|nr:TAXI family TRAP transporter solute-binding subunit [Chloroflexota bacterium]